MHVIEVKGTISTTTVLGTLGLFATSGGALLVTWRATRASAAELATALAAGRLDSADWTLDSLVGDLAAVLLLVALAVLTLFVALAVAAILLQHGLPSVADRCALLTPRAVRRLVGACCGVGLVGPLCLAGPALASDVHHQQCRQACRPVRVSLEGLRLPDLPLGAARDRAVPARAGSGHDAVVVRRGDSLWSIAARHLPPTASDVQIVALTDRLYRLNRSTIGPNPDLILPGMTLTAPEGAA